MDLMCSLIIYSYAEGGKDFRERKVIGDIYPLISSKHPKILTPIEVYHRIRASNSRNQEMIDFLRDKYSENTFAIGVYGDRPELDKDDCKAELAKSTGIEVVTFENFGYQNKMGHAAWSRDDGLWKAIEKTWSCQLWFRLQCEERKHGMCYSCKERQEYLRLMHTDA